MKNNLYNSFNISSNKYLDKLDKVGKIVIELIHYSLC